MSRPRKRLKVILIGDRCVDEYIFGKVLRLSPEAPVPVFTPCRTESKNGMAANVEDNLKALGVDVISYFGKSSTKVRFIDEKSKQHIMRADYDVISEPLDKSTYFPSDCDAFVVSDYDKGLVTYDLIQDLLKYGLPVFVDTKKTDLMKMAGAYIKINQTEYELAKTMPSDKVIVTMGADGAKAGDHVFPAPDVKIVDSCGAGDTFLAAFAYAILNGYDEKQSVRFAIRASTVTVKHIGVYSPTLEEINVS